jgi:hypothetical protein
MTVISRRTAQRARVARAEGSATAVGVGGRSEVSFGRLELLEIGAVQAADVDVAIITLSPVSRVIGTPLDGILGYNFLRNYRVTIDYATSRLYLA